VSLVIVSHSEALATGVMQLAGQMAPVVTILPVGGTDAGGLGTSFAKIAAALEEVTRDDGRAVVLTDIGSAVMTTESVLEVLGDTIRARVALADAPLVEGAVAAALAVAGGADLAGVLAAAQGACVSRARSGGGPGEPGMSKTVSEVHATIEVMNPLGLHARPAAALARAMSRLEATVTIDGVDATSVLELMALGATRGRRLKLVATGPQATAARDAATRLITSSLGEL